MGETASEMSMLWEEAVQEWLMDQLKLFCSGSTLGRDEKCMQNFGRRT